MSHTIGTTTTSEIAVNLMATPLGKDAAKRGVTEQHLADLEDYVRAQLPDAPDFEIEWCVTDEMGLFLLAVSTGLGAYPAEHPFHSLG